jgi:cell division protein FtsI (penicillin-binding protein 3)
VLHPATILRRDTASEGVRVVAQPTAEAVRLMLERAVKNGTGKAARVYGIRVAGKTGTVHKSNEGGYEDDKYRSLFAGFMPVSAPKVAAVVVIDGPRGGEHYGGLVAAPVFGSVMHDAARILNFPADALVATSITSEVELAVNRSDRAGAGVAR